MPKVTQPINSGLTHTVFLSVSLQNFPLKYFAILVYFRTAKPLTAHCERKAATNETTKARTGKKISKLEQKWVYLVGPPTQMHGPRPALGASRTPGGLVVSSSRWWPRSRGAAPAGAPTCAAQDPQDSAHASPSGRRPALRVCGGRPAAGPGTAAWGSPPEVAGRRGRGVRNGGIAPDALAVDGVPVEREASGLEVRPR